MSNNGTMSDIQTILCLMLVPALTIIVFPFQILPLDIYTQVLLLVLAVYGIQTILKMKNLQYKKLDLLPGIISDRMMVGIDAIASISWLFVNNIMPQDQWLALVTMILSALGLMAISERSFGVLRQ